MTGQVKEEVITRFGELGIRVAGGIVALSPGLLPPNDVMSFDDGPDREARSSFTMCGVAMTIDLGDVDVVTVIRPDGRSESSSGLALGADESRELLSRTGTISRVEWTIGEETMTRWSPS